MSPSALGWAALNDRSFVGQRLKRGRRVGLETADVLRRFMGELTFRPVVLCEIEAFLAITGAKAWLLGERAVRQRGFVKGLADGASPLLRTVDRLRRWMRRMLLPEQRVAMRAAVMRALRRVDVGPEGYGQR